MNLIKRFRNLWKMSDQEVTQIGITREGRAFHAFGNPTIEKPKMATIIKMHDTETIIKEILEDK